MNENAAESSGFDIKGFLKTLTQRPGVYKMLDEQHKVIYIGKAKNLKNRVSSYFRVRTASPKQQVMVQRIADIEVTMTHTEGEALLLENQLIKQYRPRYNINLRDDKSYPSIYLTTHQDFPRVGFHRGAKKKQGRYFGPYPSAGAVRESLKLLQRIFPVRQCEDTMFRNRSRPCLQYQIERCTAPCVGLIDQYEYQRDVQDTEMFLEGNGNRLIDELVLRMEQAAEKLEYERATHYRDQIAALRTILEKQYVSGAQGDIDIIACSSMGGTACVQVFFVRGGQHIGDKTFFPEMTGEYEAQKVLEAFVPQYYLGKTIPNEILISHELTDVSLLCEVLSDQANRSVQISYRLKGERRRWLSMALTNAENGLKVKLANRANLYTRYLSLQQELGCQSLPKRLECFDISHTQGDQTVASCVVFDLNGPVKSAYRRFNISGITPGDDYAALAQAVSRRFKRIKKGESEIPDILFIDGGKGQVSAVKKVLDELEFDGFLLIGVAKGPSRKAGMESFFIADDVQPLSFSSGSPGLLLVQHIRDEAHRFAITGHRQRRARTKKQSILEAIEGLGPKKRQKLLKQFGGLQEVSKAGVEALCTVDGVNRILAQRIYQTFHD